MDVTSPNADDMLRSRLRRPSSPIKTAGHLSHISDIRPAVRGYQSRDTVYGRGVRAHTQHAPNTSAKPQVPDKPRTTFTAKVSLTGSTAATSYRRSPAVIAPDILATSLVQETRNKHTTNKRPAIPRPSTSALLVAGAVFIFLVGGFVAFDSWRTNRAAEAAAKKMGSTTTHTTANNQAPDEAAPVTTAPTENDITAYEVAPSKPRLLTIPKIGVKARIVPEGVTKDGSLAAPGNVHDAGWYTSSSLPGQPGAMLLDGHVSSWTTNGVFYSLKKLAVGDVISVERGDGKILQYKVVKSQSYDAASVDMQAAVTPVVPGTPGLNLITCTGKVKPGTSDFSERLVVFTKQIN